MDLVILGMGTAAPAHTLAQAEAASISKTTICAGIGASKFIDRIYSAAGVQSRGSVLAATPEADGSERFFLPASHPDDRGPSTEKRMARYATDALPLATAASAQAIANSGISPDRIRHLITVSCTGFAAPGIDVGLIAALGLRPDVTRTNIGFMGCHGAINAMRVAHGLAALQPDDSILLCAAELCSLHFCYESGPQFTIANALFADGAGAVVLRARDKDSRHPRLVATTSRILPGTADLLRWTIGDHGFRMTLSPQVPEIVKTHVSDWLQTWLMTMNLDLHRIQSWAVHPGGPKILDAVEAALKLPPTAMAPSRRVLARHGNMSSPTLLFILDALFRENAPRPIVALGFGPGIALEAALIL